MCLTHLYTLKVKKAASVDSKTKMKWSRHKQQHEELTQLKISDLPCKTTFTTSDNKEEQDDEDDDNEESNKGVQQGGDIQTTLSAFAYASTPPPPALKRQSQQLRSTTKDGSSNSSSSNNKWKNRLSLIRPAASFLKLNNNSNSSMAIINGP